MGSHLGMKRSEGGRRAAPNLLLNLTKLARFAARLRRLSGIR